MTKAILIALMLLVTTQAAQAKPISCWTVLPYVWIYGEEAVVAWAKVHGYTAEQIASVKRKCEDEHTARK